MSGVKRCVQVHRGRAKLKLYMILISRAKELQERPSTFAMASRTDRLQNEKGNGNHRDSRSKGGSERARERGAASNKFPSRLSSFLHNSRFFFSVLHFRSNQRTNVDWSTAAAPPPPPPMDGWLLLFFLQDMDGRTANGRSVRRTAAISLKLEASCGGKVRNVVVCCFFLFAGKWSKPTLVTRPASGSIMAWSSLSAMTIVAGLLPPRGRECFSKCAPSVRPSFRSLPLSIFDRRRCYVT